MKYLQLLLFTLGVNLLVGNTVVAADTPTADQDSGSGKSVPDDTAEPECD